MEEKETPLLAFIHELSAYMPILNGSASLISKATSGKTDIASIISSANNILEIVEIINTHLTLLNIELNREFYTIQKPQPLNIHGIFMRTAKILKVKAKTKDLKIELKTFTKIPEIECLKIITALPFIILDNCIKYSMKSSIIDIEFSILSHNLIVTISSEGPKVSNNEIQKLTNKGYRGENAQKINPDGQGLGLHYLKTICELCNINYTLHSHNNHYTFGNIDYSTFTVSLYIPYL
jgi:signal transduction histidine kinase